MDNGISDNGASKEEQGRQPGPSYDKADIKTPTENAKSGHPEKSLSRVQSFNLL